MTKVTYLFGAGASVGIRSEKSNERLGLPIVNELPGRINELIIEVRNKNLWLTHDKFQGHSDKSKRKYQEKLFEDLDWLSKEASNHSSVDTLAKKLFLMGERKASDLKKLKISLSMFFVLEQARRRVDIRYDSFFASILTKDVYKFPPNIRILSWNYDYQFEKAFSEYCDLKKLSEIQKILNVVSKGTPKKPPKGFSIVKLNGTTTFTEENGNRIEALESNTVKLLEDTNTIDFLTNYYAHFTDKNCKPDISFAWESEGLKGQTIIDKAITCTKGTEVLVVIGYSFPFFNREVDRAIIGAMSKLKKVYFQAPAPHHEKIRTRFQAIRQDINPKNLVAYDEVESFLLPDELEL